MLGRGEEEERKLGKGIEMTSPSVRIQEKGSDFSLGGKKDQRGLKSRSPQGRGGMRSEIEGSAKRNKGGENRKEKN